jgi:hypothetical protein
VITLSYGGYYADVQMSGVAIAAAVTVSVAGASYAAFNPDVLVSRTVAVADQADCRTVDAAIVAYVAGHDAPPAGIDDIRPYVRGDISAYRISGGMAAGPGCP